MNPYYRCEKCGGELVPDETGEKLICKSCDSVRRKFSQEDDAYIRGYNRANELRIQREFDKALKIYEDLAVKFDCGAETYWQMVLCKYGIEYVDDQRTGRKIPTCNRLSYTSVLQDIDYKKVLELSYGDYAYREMADEIETLRKDILAYAEKEEPYEVFISYKEIDDNTRTKTKDSATARELYDRLDAKKIRTFYAPKSIRIGAMSYEAVIFAAIHSAKVMIVLGSKEEYFDSVWVKNEWSRFQKLIVEDRKVKRWLIPAYYEINPMMQLPPELRGIQGVDLGTRDGMDKLVQDIADRIKPDNRAHSEPIAPLSESIHVDGDVNNMLRVARFHMENGYITKARTEYEKIREIDFENAEAWWGLLLTSRNCISDEQLISIGRVICDAPEYRQAILCADAKEKERFENVNKRINDKIKDYQKRIKDKINKWMVEARIREEFEILKDKEKREIEKEQQEYANLEKDCKALKYLIKCATEEIQESKHRADQIHKHACELIEEFGNYKSLSFKARKTEEALEAEKKKLSEEANRLLSLGKKMDYGGQPVDIEDTLLKLQRRKNELEDLRRAREDKQIDFVSRIKNEFEQYDKMLKKAERGYFDEVDRYLAQ